MRNTKTTQIVKAELTFIDKIRDKDTIKALLGADDVQIKDDKVFLHDDNADLTELNDDRVDEIVDAVQNVEDILMATGKNYEMYYDPDKCVYYFSFYVGN